MQANPSLPESPPPRAGFTLIELIVVIGIVALLASLVVTGSVALVERSEVQQTRRTLELLDLAMVEWETTADRQLSWYDHYDDQLNPPNDPDRFDVHADTPEVLILTEMLDVIMRADSVRDIIGQIDANLVYEFETGEYPVWLEHPAERSVMESDFVGSKTILDAWGTPIYATHPGSVWHQGYADAGIYPEYMANEDGTIQTYNEIAYGVARNRRICFVSAGPDGDFGFLVGNPALKRAVADNIYSYQPDDP